MESKISEKMMREVYFKAFGKEYDSLDRKQTPLPLEIAYKVALNKLKRDKKYEFGGEITEDIYYKSVNDFVFFCLNYPSNFFNIFGGFEKDFANKFKAYYNGYGSYGAMIKLYIELDSNNRRLLTDFAYKNYNISFSKSNISEVEYYNSVNHFVFFCFNFPNNFMEAFPINLRVNLSEKWSDAYRKKGSIGAMIYFWSLLSDDNRKKLADWVRVNYTGTRLYELGGALGDVAGMLPSPLPMSTIQPMAKGGSVSKNSKICFDVINDGYGSLELGSYSFDFTNEKGTTSKHRVFYRMQDAFEVLFGHLKSESAEFILENNPFSNYIIQEVSYNNKDTDYDGYPELKYKNLFKISAKKVKELLESNKFKKGGQIELFADGGNVLEPNIYYFNDGENDITFNNFEEAYNEAEKLGYNKFRDDLGGEYFINRDIQNKYANGGGVDDFKMSYDEMTTYEKSNHIHYNPINSRWEVTKNGENKEFWNQEQAEKYAGFEFENEKDARYSRKKYEALFGYADGGRIKVGDVVEVKEPNYGRDRDYYVVADNVGGGNDFLISDVNKREQGVFEEEQLKKLYADGGKLNEDKYDYEDIGQFSIPDSEWKNYSDEEFYKIGKKIVNEQFDGNVGLAYDTVVYKKMANGGGVGKKSDRNETQENNFGISYKLGDKFILGKTFGNNKDVEVYITEIMPSGLFFKVDKSDKIFSIKTLRSKGSTITKGEYLIPIKKEYADGGGIKSDYYIFEGVDNLNGKPLYRVESTSESDIEYVGEWHTKRDDAKNELDELLNKSKKTLGVVKVIFENPAYNYSTNVGVDVTEEEARNYFVGKMFDVGAFPKENMQKVIDIEFSKSKDNYADGGEIVDLFEDYENIPANVQEVLDRYSEKYGEDFGEMNYNDMAEMHKEIEKLGYTFDSGLDNMPYGLRPIGVELNQLRGYEEFGLGGFLFGAGVGVLGYKLYLDSKTKKGKEKIKKTYTKIKKKVGLD